MSLHPDIQLENICHFVQVKLNAVFVTKDGDVLLLRRLSPTFADKEFMTIVAAPDGIEFHHGHYDLTFDEAVEDFNQRKAQQ